jgi:hypothetical protein
LADAAQKLHREIVARLERPVREADQIGEEDRELVPAPASPLRLRQSLPDLERAKAGLAQEAGPLRGQRREPPADDLRALPPRGGQRVPE